jgi:hypothetical protein
MQHAIENAVCGLGVSSPVVRVDDENTSWYRGSAPIAFGLLRVGVGDLGSFEMRRI